MSDHLEHSRRWEHRTTARPTSHWHDQQVVPGPVDSCPVCTPPKEEES